MIVVILRGLSTIYRKGVHNVLCGVCYIMFFVQVVPRIICMSRVLSNIV